MNPIELGKRISAARKARNVSQDRAAQHLGISRPTYIAMEKGSRPFKPNEIILVADLLGRSVHEMVGERAPVSEFAPQFRLTQTSQLAETNVEEAVEQFRRVCDDYVWLEKLLGAPTPRHKYIEEYDVSVGNTQALAEDIAGLERSRLGLGQGPILNLIEVLESQVGLRVFALPLDEFRIAGMFVYTDALGGCILMNGKHPRTRRLWSAAHEYAHFLSGRYQSEVTFLQDYERKPRSEQFADLFAASFLMPAASIRQRFHSVVQSKRDFRVADLCILADQFGVSVEAMTRRLERLACVRPGTWNKLTQQGVTGRNGQAQLNIPVEQGDRVKLPFRFRQLAVQAFEEEKITEGQLARLLRCSRVEAREAVEKFTLAEEIDQSSAATYQLSLNFGDHVDIAAAERD